MPAPPSASAERIKDANIRYHDAAATEYDTKWGIDFGGIGQAQAVSGSHSRNSRAWRRFHLCIDTTRHAAREAYVHILAPLAGE